MPPSTLTRGREGENIAAAYLESIGYTIRERNVRLHHDEIDIVAYDPGNRMMVFAEVKTRRQNPDAYPIRTAIDKRKRTAMRRAVARWVAKHDYDGPGRTDLLCVEGDRIVDHVMDLGSPFY